MLVISHKFLQRINEKEPTPRGAWQWSYDPIVQIGHSLEYFLPSGATPMVLGAMLQPMNLCVWVKVEI